jgi:5-methylcytosine-specific restriction endonuclease McrA
LNQVVGLRTLLLNSTYEPLRVVSWQRAITMLLVDKVEVVSNYDMVLRAMSWSIQMPSVVKLRRFVRRRRVRVALTRRNVFFRDGHQCQYCLHKLPARELTCDHVIPRSQGGRTSWDNLVTACGPCNRRKGGRTPEQARMGLVRLPSRPESLPVEFTLNVNSGNLPEVWREYLGWTASIEAA